jgi:hypothetical protein
MKSVKTKRDFKIQNDYEQYLVSFCNAEDELFQNLEYLFLTYKA